MNVRIGESFLVSWSSQNADTATGGNGGLNGQSSITASIAGPYIYAMTFTGRGGQVSCSITVQVSSSGGYY